MSKDIDPNYISPDDLLYIRDRENLRQEFILQGYGDPLDEKYPGLVDDDGNYLNGSGPDSSSPEPEGDLASEGDTNVQAHLPEDQQWSDENKSDELKAVIEARNAGRDEADQIVPQGTGQDGNVKKDDLFAALREDDEKIAAWLAEHPDE